MGFGIIFFGYALAYLMSLNSFGFFFRLTGCAVMFAGLCGVAQYELRFRKAESLAVLMSIACVGETLSTVLYDYTAYSPVWLTEETKYYFFSAFGVLSVIFHVFFYRAVRKIAKDVGINSIFSRSIKYEIIAVAETILIVTTYISFNFKAKFVNYIYAAAIILLYLLIVLNLTLIYSCYKNICEEGDEEAPRKKSHLPFLNRLWDLSDKREQEIYDKTKSYAENRIKTDNQKKKHRKK